MSVFNRIKMENISFRKEKNPLSSETSYLISKINEYVKSKTKDGVAPEVTDTIVYDVVRSYIKQQYQIIETLAKQERTNKIEAAIGESKNNIEFMKSYLPEPISIETINRDIEVILATIDNPSQKSMGIVISALKKKYGDMFDGSVISPIVKAKL